MKYKKIEESLNYLHKCDILKIIRLMKEDTNESPCIYN
jgi:hypothetical protein